MNKTIHKTFAREDFRSLLPKVKKNDDALIVLMLEMSAYLNEASRDLLQPRPEAVAAILRFSRKS